MLTKEQIDNLTIRGEIALAVFTLSGIERQILSNQAMVHELVSELENWLTLPVEQIKSNTSTVLYEKYSELLLNEMSNSKEKVLIDSYSLCFHLFLFILHAMEGAEYLLFPNKETEPTSDVIEEDTTLVITYFNDCAALLQDISFETKLSAFYNTLIINHLYTEKNSIGEPINKISTMTSS